MYEFVIFTPLHNWELHTLEHWGYAGTRITAVCELFTMTKTHWHNGHKTLRRGNTIIRNQTQCHHEWNDSANRSQNQRHQLRWPWFCLHELNHACNLHAWLNSWRQRASTTASGSLVRGRSLNQLRSSFCYGVIRCGKVGSLSTVTGAK